jgi:hypothetical protein
LQDETLFPAIFLSSTTSNDLQEISLMATSPHPVPITHIVAATLHLAAEHHSAGRLPEATALYRGVAMRQRGQTEQSRRMLDRALALDPNRDLFRRALLTVAEGHA